MNEEEEALLSRPVSEQDHSQGPADAPVTLVEYGDYECPYCGRAYPIVKEVQQRMGSRLRFIFRNFPLAQLHPHAEHAAEAAETVGALGKFWEMHDALYENQRALDDSHLVTYAQHVGVNAQEFIAAMTERKYATRVRDDFQSGIMSGVNGTPTFYINGIRHDASWDTETLLAAIEAAAE